MRDEYLDNRGHDLALALDVQTRGPGRRSNPAVWQETIEQALQAHHESVAFLALINQDQVLATAGEASVEQLGAPPGLRRFRDSTLYLFEWPLMAPGQSRSGMMPAIAGWRIRIGLYTAPAAFIIRQAYVHLVAAGVAILTLLGLTFYFLRTLSRFLELKTREQSERHLAMLGRMAATLAHEIRNPLGAMKGLTQIVQEDLPKDHQGQAHMQTVVSEAERLEQLVNDLLTFARPRNREVKRFDLMRLITDVNAMLQPKLAEAEVSVNVIAGADALIVESDENGLRQVLLNVLLNAIEASPPGSAVTVATKHSRGTRQITIEVDDAGVGLGDRDPEEFFQPFMTTKVKGSGLGLAVSRQIVEQLGGAVCLANRLEGGARCTIKLPTRLK
jgi:two-component system sensor histidine kinase HydH